MSHNSGALEALFTAGQRIWVAGSSNEPQALLELLGELPLPADLTFIQFPLPGMNGTDFSGLSPTTRMETFFMSPALKGAAADRLSYVPMQMRAVYDYLAHDLDGVLLQAARNADGELCLGPNVDFAAAALEATRFLAVEVNEAITAPAGAPRLSRKPDFSITSSRPLPELPAPAIDDAAAAIGRLVAQLVKDGDCIQTGIGSIPAAILRELTAHNDLGLHGGLIDDGGMALVRAGNVTGARKAIDRGLHITGMALGSAELYDWLAGEPAVRFRGADHTHEVSVIRELENFVSVNSAVEVDLFGQVNAEFAGGRQLSGTGGSVDFMRSARSSRGGRSIIAKNATARGGTVSRIVPRVEMVTALRTDVDRVVTEYGVAELDGVGVAERARRLIAIAAPEFRDALLEAAPN
ncbi:MAG: acetyl-CoA hydrolase/transferase C-terminal domain-containing protein [Pseudomonadota bacterium]